MEGQREIEEKTERERGSRMEGVIEAGGKERERRISTPFYRRPEPQRRCMSSPKSHGH